ncbi:MAG: ABC transporter ATP-binding protein [Nitrospinota bacterium]|nr:ABC transporter ATP-binding protein [Nitrospinota bacterium]
MIEKIKIEVRDLTKSFSDNEVLRSLNLKVEEGKITAIIGRSGEGKSVLFKHIIGLMNPDSGDVYIDDIKISDLSAQELNKVRAKFGVLFQSAALFDSMTVKENVAFPLAEHSEFSKDEINNRVRDSLRLVELEGIEDRMPSQLSGGMRKRVGLARAIIREPEIILYDEPTTGLDPILADSIHGLILSLQRKLNITSLVITHDVDNTLKFAHSVAMLHDGKILTHCTPEEIKLVEDPFVQQFLSGSSTGPLKVL